MGSTGIAMATDHAYCTPPTPQCIKLLYTETKKGSTLLYYLTGNRVLRYAQRSLTNEKALTKLLR